MKTILYTGFYTLIIGLMGWIVLAPTPSNHSTVVQKVEINATKDQLKDSKKTITNQIRHDWQEKKESTTTDYFSQDAKLAIIGGDHGSDEPGDNAFSFEISKLPREKSNIYLEYELFGVEDFTCISHSINNNLATGGAIIKRSNKWSKQCERINPEQIQIGKNRVLFTSFSDKEYSYMVKNMVIRVEDDHTAGDRRLVVNQPSTSYYYNTFGYLQGFVTGKGSKDATISINNRNVNITDGIFESVVNKPEGTGEKWKAEIVATFPDGQIIKSAVDFIQPDVADYYNNLNKELWRSEALVKSNSPFEISIPGASISSDSCSLGGDRNISVTALRDVDFSPVSAGLVNVTGKHSGYRFLPHGEIFDRDIEITLSYDSCLIPTGYSPKDILTCYFDENSNRWVPLKRKSINLSQHTITSYTNHFTDMINGIIKLPESPQSSAFTPTSLKDIKAANPLEGMRVIEPPKANDKGTASLSFPIEIPQGRMGMQPNLAIQYNSGGGNGWMGMGWDLKIPAISTETRWGVPKYDPVSETETYLLNGEQIVISDPHDSTGMNYRNVPVFRQKLETRRTGNQRFFPRVEGAFNKIIRHGNHTDTYWWEVTDRNGMTSFYGKKTNSDELDTNSVLRDEHGNIAYWALTETRDLHGNAVIYKYDLVFNTGIDNGNYLGRQLYISEINYTAYQTTSGLNPGYYCVIFNRYNDNDNPRPDKIINGRYGLKEVTAGLLKSIEVNYDVSNSNKNIRKYYFVYKSGEFNKTLLCGFCELDEGESPSAVNTLETSRFKDGCTLFNDLNVVKKHVFDYYDDIYVNDQYELFEANPISITTYQDHENAIFHREKRTTAIGGIKEKNWGIGGELFLGFDINVLSNSLSVGGTFDYSESKSEGANTLIDLNGDGLPDKVFYQKDHGMRYRKQIIDSSGNVSFASSPVVISGHDRFLYQQGVTRAWGGKIVFGVKGAYSNPVSSNYTKIYFSDVNGDGLPDIVDNGNIYFNNLNSNDDPEFKPFTTDTAFIGTNSCEYIFPEGKVNDSVEIINAFEGRPEVINDVAVELDAVRIWIAPYDGQITLTNNIRLIEDTSLSRRNSRHADGVRYIVQHNSSYNNDSIDRLIGPDDYNQKTVIKTMQVYKGDRLFFRLLSLEDRSFDNVIWNPEIKYSSNNEVDADQKHIHQYKPSEEFVLSSYKKFYAPVTGKLQYNLPISFPALSDTLRLVITKNNTALTSNVFSGMYPVSTSITDSVDVTEYDSIEIKLFANTNINWSSIQIRPVFYYSSIITGDPPAPAKPSYIVDENETDSINPFEYHPSVNFRLFPQTLYPTNRISSLNGNYLAYPNLALTPGCPDGSITMSVKKDNVLLSKQILNITAGTLLVNSPALPFSVSTGNDVMVDYYTTNAELADYIYNCHVTINNTSYNAGFHTVFPDSLNIKYGNLYRGWGFFTYNNVNTGTYVINEDSLLIPSDSPFQPTLTANDTSYDVIKNAIKNQGANPLNHKLLIMSTDDKNSMYSSLANQTWINADTIGHFFILERIPMCEEAIPLISLNKNKVLTINKHSESKTWNYAISGGASLLNGGRNWSTGNSQVLLDYFDANGDKYPDIIGDSYIQFSAQQGGLNPYVTSHTMVNGPTINQNYNQAFGTNLSLGFSVIEDKHLTFSNNAHSIIKTTGSISSSLALGQNQAHFTMMDVNGDGLPDKVVDNGKVYLNLGYKFIEAENWDFDALSKCVNENFGASLGLEFEQSFQKACYSLSGGLGFSRADNQEYTLWNDFNGDGLIDKGYITLDQLNPEPVFSLHISFNTGAGFTSSTTFDPHTLTDYSQTNAEAVNLSGTFGCPIPLINIKICATLNGSKSWSFTKDKIKLMDMNGDGFPDLVKSDEEGHMDVYYSKIGRTNLLKEVNNYLGGKFVMDYKLTEPGYSQPQRAYTLNSLKIYDGFTGDGPDYKLLTFDYEGGYYSRFERENLGFKTVKTHQFNTAVSTPYCYRTTTEKFHNTNFLFKGLKHFESLQDSANRIFKISKYTYVLKEIATGNFIDSVHDYCYGPGYPAIAQEDHYYYEGQPNDYMHTSKQYIHGTYGNIMQYVDNGQDDIMWDNVQSDITYHSNYTGKNLLSAPATIYISGEMAARERSAEIDSSGNVTQITINTGSGNAYYNLDYDEFGNLANITYPENINGERMKYVYSYDPIVHSYITELSDTLGYHSFSDYDLRFGKVTTSKDITGNQIIYSYDNRGRLTQINGPYEPGNGFLLKFEYWDRAGRIMGTSRADHVPWARTLHYDPDDTIPVADPIITVLFSDAEGKALQIKKDISLFINGSKRDRMSVSGRLEFDAFDRTIASYYPLVEEPEGDSIFNDTYDTVSPSIVKYDLMDRKVKTTTPDGKNTNFSFGFGLNRYFDKMFTTTLTDANGYTTIQYADAAGRKTSVKAPYDTWTSWEYDALGDVLATIDPGNNKTEYTYDYLGKRTSRHHPDAGFTYYSYDVAGNLVTSQTMNLYNNNEYINYRYHFNRLTGIDYPEHPENNVRYEYGDYYSTGSNQAGRIVKQLDASGLQQFWYGKLGEIIKNSRTFVMPYDKPMTFTTLFRYDSWNRIKKITYPDGEALNYYYNHGGLLDSLVGLKNSTTYHYINTIRYDKFEKRTYMAEGNGTKREYYYHPVTQRLSRLVAKASDNNAMLDKRYYYDNTDNIIHLKDSASQHTYNSQNIGGYSEYYYTYDSLYRLRTSSGNWHSTTVTDAMELGLTYGPCGEILSKTQDHEHNGQPVTKTSYSSNYSYSGSQPHAASTIGNMDYIYDDNGNVIEGINNKTFDGQHYVWDEDNRLKLFCNHEIAGSYLYDLSGERYLKILGNHISQVINGNTTIEGYAEESQTLYVNPYMVVTPSEYTKHYYIEGERIASKIGGGLDEDENNVNAGETDISKIHRKPYIGVDTYLTLFGFHLQSENDFYDKTDSIQRMLDADLDHIGEGGYLSFNVLLRPLMQQELLRNEYESLIYYYHPDHLGSSSFISDNAGSPSQHLEYFPFGETFVDENIGSYNTPYKFNAKELDEESGLYYYGARYYDSKGGIWLGVDPLSDKYPGLSPFAYCADNPVILVDPNGMETIKPPTQDEYRQFDITKQAQQRFEAIIHNIESFTENKELMNAFSQTTGLNSERIKEYFKYGSGPKAEITLGNWAYAAGPDKFYIGNDILNYLGNIKEDDNQKLGLQAFGIAMVLIDELSHNGDMEYNQTLTSTGTNKDNPGRQNWPLSPVLHRGGDSQLFGFGVEALINTTNSISRNGRQCFSGEIQIQKPSRLPINYPNIPKPPMFNEAKNISTGLRLLK